MILLDTNVLSALRKPDRFPQVTTWFVGLPDADIYLSAITLGEIERGIVLQEQKNPDFATALRDWINQTVQLFSDRILDFTAADARIWGQLSANMGHLSADQMIAASAITRNAGVATRNVRDFEPTGVQIVNPFEHRDLTFLP